MCGISAVELCRSCVRLFVPSVFGHRAGDRGSRESRGAGDVDLERGFCEISIWVTFLFLRWAQTPKGNPLMLGRVTQCSTQFLTCGWGRGCPRIEP